MEKITIYLPKDVVTVLKAQARNKSLSFATYLRQLVLKGITLQQQGRSKNEIVWEILQEILFGLSVIRRELALIGIKSGYLSKEEVKKIKTSVNRAVAEYIQSLL